MEKIKILGIAPFENMKKSMDTLANQFDTIELVSYIGDLEEGTKIGKKYQNDFDVIISRGGTAKLLASQCRIPVVEIEISILDILRVIKLVESYNSHYAFIGFPNITKQIVILAEILEQSINIITIEEKKELPEVVRKLKEDGVSLIIGDHVTLKYANEYSINAMLIDSGNESISESIKKAFFIGENFKKAQYFNNFEKEIQKELGFCTFIFNSKLERIFASNSLATKKNSIVQKFVTEFKNEQTSKKSKHIQFYNSLLFLEGTKRNNNYYVILKKTSNYFKQNNQPLTFLDLTHNLSDELSNSSAFIGNNQKVIENAVKHTKKFFIYGEKGTGKNKAATIIAKKLDKKNNWYIDFSKNITENDWEKLLYSSSSIFLDTDSTFILSDIEKINFTRAKELLHFINNYEVESNRWIITYTSSASELKDEHLKILQTEFNGYQIKMEALRLRKNELTSLVTIYIYQLNKELGKNVLGFEPSAYQVLYDYNWPENIDQLKRVLRQLMIMTKTSFISKKNTENVILHEKQVTNNIYQETSFSDTLLKNNSLEIIEKKIIKRVVELYGFNKTNAAKSLDVSRSTLWRYLK